MRTESCAAMCVTDPEVARAWIAYCDKRVAELRSAPLPPEPEAKPPRGMKWFCMLVYHAGWAWCSENGAQYRLEISEPTRSWVWVPSPPAVSCGAARHLSRRQQRKDLAAAKPQSAGRAIRTARLR